MDNNAPTSSSSTSNPSVLGHGGLKSSMLISRFSTRNLYELQLKEANHESMMQRFQLRKVSDIVATDNTSTNGGLLSPRSLALFTKRKTWVKLWHGMSSPLVPGSGACICHGLVMFGAILFQLFYLPFSVSYYPNGSPSIVRAGIALQLIYMVDLILNLNTAFVKKQKLVVSRISIARNHISKWFGLELVSAVPVGLAYGYQEHVSKSTLVFLLRYDACLIVLRLSRILLVEHNFLPSRVRSSKRLTSWLMYSRYSHMLGIAKLIWLVLLVAHYMACLWHVTAASHFMEVNISEKYVADFYYAIQLIQGQGGVTGTWEENVLSTIIILAGSLILATVFGNVAMLVSNFNANTTSYRQKMEGVFATMDKMGLPLKLRERVHQYYTHVWMEYESLDGDIVRFQRELAHTLRLEVGLYKYMNLVVRIPFWESCSPDFATQIILSLVVRVYLPDDYVVRKGDTGAEMFMINRGICEVSDPATAQQPCMNILASSSDKSFPETGGIGSTLAVNATTIDPVDNSEWGTGTILLPDLSSRTFVQFSEAAH
ncbi:unnamed protein product [Phytophthora lilii]|uniref:Unnamed protein product n=1 Tax=Phytophthora lilii TaxID=2077276 RepID=A0A9W6WR69_9STRA|nr:unnamed protein product [Phytophthora lilii]